MKAFFTFLFTCLFLFVRSQQLLTPASLEQRTTNSSLIIEGTVIAKSGFKPENINRIYTKNVIAVTAVLKGTVQADTITLITQGGILSDEMMVCHELLSLRQNEKGIFFCNPVKGTKSAWNAYTEKQGFLKYDHQNKTASDPFRKYEITNLFNTIQQLTGQPLKRKNTETSKQSSAAIPVITSFSPTTITAGTNSQLTIIGTGFGNTRGSGDVLFKNADEGGNSSIAAWPVQYKSWTDNQIVVEVPSEAGTGTIEVSTASGTAISTGILKVLFARSQIEYEGNIYSPVLIDQMAGGYPWRMYSEFESDSFPKASFLRAFNRWRCVSGVNWFIGSTTNIDKTERDEINIIRFDEGEELPSNVLAVCYSYYKACVAAQWYVSEYDIIFDKETNWEYGPAAAIVPKFDFESVAFHELGHGHQLGHVINQQDVMHYAIAPGTMQRYPNQDDTDGAKLVMSQSTKSICGFDPMKPVTPDVCDDSWFAYFEAEPPRVYPVPVTGLLNVSYFLTDDQVVEINLYDVTGKQIIQLLKAEQKKGEHTISKDVSSFSLRKGTYILQSKINGQEYSRKIISVM
jgi:hypothetical protein